jgi:metallo-beta-lactamase class B
VKKILTFIITIIYSTFLPAQETPKLRITHLTDNFYVFTTYKDYKGTLFPSNGMYVVTNKGVVMFDCPWDSTQYQPLLDSINAKHNKRVVMCMATHFHEDRTGAFAYYRQKGIKTFASKETDIMCENRKEKRAEFTFNKNSSFMVGEHKFHTGFSGEGHTQDNIVVWFPKQKILYGGCLVKSTEATDLGNLEDADVKAWKQTMKNLKKKYKKASYVIPGHQAWSNGILALEHTLKLLEEHKK